MAEKSDFYKRSKKKSTKGTKNEQKKDCRTKIRLQCTPSMYADNMPRPQLNCENVANVGIQTHTNHDIKKRKAATKICILMRFTCFAEPKNREVFHFPHFSTLSLHADTTHSCVANAQASLCVCVCVCVPASISVKIFHLQFKSMTRLKAAAAALAQKSMQQKYENLSWPEAISQFARNSQLN